MGTERGKRVAAFEETIEGRNGRGSAAPFAARTCAGLVPLTLLLLAAGCGKKQGKPKPPAPVVSVVKLSLQSVRVYREYVGRTDAFLSVDLRPQIDALITGFYFRDGQQVRKGQLLYRLDARPYQVALDAARARLERSDADAARAKAELAKAQDYVRRYAPLAGIDAVPRQDYTDALAEQEVRAAELRQAEADRRMAQATVEQAQVTLSYTEIRAPLSGVIGFRRMATGGLVATTDATPLATISVSDPLRVDFAVSDADYLRYLAPAQAAMPPGHSSGKQANDPGQMDWKLVLADGSTYPRPGKFYALARTANLQTGTVEVELLYPNPEARLRPGEYAKVRADVERRENVLLIPVSCVRVSQGTKIVSVVGPNNEVAEKTVETEARSGNSYIVTKGLQPGDVVIVGGQQKAKPGDKVEPRIDQPPAPQGDQPGTVGAQGETAPPPTKEKQEHRGRKGKGESAKKPESSGTGGGSYSGGGADHKKPGKRKTPS